MCTHSASICILELGPLVDSRAGLPFLLGGERKSVFISQSLPVRVPKGPIIRELLNNTWRELLGVFGGACRVGHTMKITGLEFTE